MPLFRGRGDRPGLLGEAATAAMTGRTTGATAAMTGRTTGGTAAMTGRTTGGTAAMTGRTTGGTAAMTGRTTGGTAVVAGPGCSGNCELDVQGGHAAARSVPRRPQTGGATRAYREEWPWP